MKKKTQTIHAEEMDDLQEKYSIFPYQDEDKKLKKIRDEYDEGYKHVELKRKTKYEDLRLYVEESKDKIRNYLVYTFVQTYLSVFYTGDLSVRWSGSDGKVREVADNINQMAEFDYREMGLFEKDYLWIWYSLMMGVGVQLYKGFDTVTKTPIIANVNPLSVIPDPYFTSFGIEGHRYFGVEMEVTLSEMKRLGFKNVDLVSNTKMTDNLYRQYLQKYRAYGREETTDGIFKVYYHYTEIDGEKYLFVTSNDNRTLHYEEKIEPVLNEEKEGSEYIKYPFVLRYFSPLDGDFFGVSLLDLVKNDQKFVNELTNLILIKTRKSAYGNDEYYAESALPEGISAEELNKPSINGRKIPLRLDPGQSIQDVIYEKPQSSQEQHVYDMVDRLKNNSKETTSLDFATLGMVNPAGNTLGEQKIASTNALSRFLLVLKYAKWAEKARWMMWMRLYIANEKLVKNKLIYLTSPNNRVFNKTFTSDDFITKEPLLIEIEFKIEREERNKKVGEFVGLAPQFLANAKSDSQRAIITRRQLEIMGMEQNEILRMIPYTLDELKARTALELLNNDDPEGEEIEDLVGEDHQVFIDIFEQGVKNKSNGRAITKRLMALEYRERILGTNTQNANAEEQNQMMANIGTAQTVANSLGNKSQDLPTNTSIG